MPEYGAESQRGGMRAGEKDGEGNAEGMRWIAEEREDCAGGEAVAGSDTAGSRTGGTTAAGMAGAGWPRAALRPDDGLKTGCGNATTRQFKVGEV